MPATNTGWAGEISLDLDMVSAICPGYPILLVEATSSSIGNLGTALNTAVNMGAKFVSNGYGDSGDGSANSFDSSYYNHPGVVITASSGDSGFGVSYPASGKGVTAVGGTSLVRDSSARGWSETVWKVRARDARCRWPSQPSRSGSPPVAPSAPRPTSPQ